MSELQLIDLIEKVEDNKDKVPNAPFVLETLRRGLYVARVMSQNDLDLYLKSVLSQDYYNIIEGL
jgi:hypothetical protein